ncbi:hypothetical protein EJK17_00495 [Lactobacillus xujianguonis]|uniref:Uncharacterized protein n=1 Tax=Lactobacillus xujianguonis TaxID=2495899 RepID=A0A437SXZ0_9LACO|nr:hypothetical protein [Lactobacillus xujianguonis]RVU71789.1 hypothetical protein EJK17_00495 [Lactobacillus xujianguonis]
MIRLLAIVFLVWLYLWNVAAAIERANTRDGYEIAGHIILGLVGRTISLCLIYWALNTLGM